MRIDLSRTQLVQAVTWYLVTRGFIARSNTPYKCSVGRAGDTSRVTISANKEYAYYSVNEYNLSHDQLKEALVAYIFRMSLISQPLVDSVEAHIHVSWWRPNIVVEGLGGYFAYSSFDAYRSMFVPNREDTATASAPQQLDSPDSPEEASKTSDPKEKNDEAPTRYDHLLEEDAD